MNQHVANKKSEVVTIQPGFFIRVKKWSCCDREGKVIQPRHKQSHGTHANLGKRSNAPKSALSAVIKIKPILSQRGNVNRRCEYPSSSTEVSSYHQTCMT